MNVTYARGTPLHEKMIFRVIAVLLGMAGIMLLLETGFRVYYANIKQPSKPPVYAVQDIENSLGKGGHTAGMTG